MKSTHNKNWDSQILGIVAKWSFFYPLTLAVIVTVFVLLIEGFVDGWGIIAALFYGYYALLIIGTISNLNVIGKTFTTLEKEEPKILKKATLYYCLIMGTYLCLLPFMIRIWVLGFLIINPGTILISIAIASITNPYKKE